MSSRIWQWTLTPDAIASCFAKDVLDMRESGVKDAEYFWLGRVPCRTVKLAGILVGVQTYESRIVYSLDDGSSVIDCIHKAPAPPPNKKEDPPLLKPSAYLGDSVFIVGRISPWRDTRRIMIDSIVRCPSSDDEPQHWIAVRALHKNHYQLDEPWEIPERPPPSQLAPTTAPLGHTTILPSTPSSSAPSSTVNSPVKMTPSRASPPKLRHPSRLHTQDLTDNAFRIYVKHYMDNADHLRRPAPGPAPTTPTLSRNRPLPLNDETPRPYNRTPGGIIPLDFAPPLLPPETSPGKEVARGFTVSYLRRVPELALMAKRVVKAEAKRRAREARRKAKESGVDGGISAQIKSKATREDKEKLHPRMKRLFVWGVQQLMKDGDVIIWDAARPYSELELERELDADLDASGGLWKINSSRSTVGADSTAISSASIAEDDEDEGVLSDPETGEQAYISLSPAFVAAQAERTIRTLVDEAAARVRANARARSGPPPGPTARDILSNLQHDDAWQYVSEFTIRAGLEFLKEEGRVWVVGGERWQLTV